MSEYTFIGSRITFPTIRDYIFSHKLNEGDAIVLHRSDFEALIHEMRTSGEEMPDFPMKLLGVLMTQDTTDTVPHGKVQIVNGEKQF